MEISKLFERDRSRCLFFVFGFTLLCNAAIVLFCHYFAGLGTGTMEYDAIARNLAAGRGNPAVEDIHLLQALLDQEGGVAGPLLGRLNVRPDELQEKF